MPVRQWTEEQKKAQAEKIREYKPWLMSGGAHTDEGKKKSSQNALKTGEYTADKVKERKDIATKKRNLCPIFGGKTYGDKRYADNRSNKYKGAFCLSWSKYADIRKRLKAYVWWDTNVVGK